MEFFRKTLDPIIALSAIAVLDIFMFLLMGAIANNSGISASLFRAARAWFGALPGGLAVATNVACAGFAAR